MKPTLRFIILLTFKLIVLILIDILLQNLCHQLLTYHLANTPGDTLN